MIETGKKIVPHGRCHVARHGTHGRQQWQSAAVVLDGFVGDGGGVMCQQGVGQFGGDTGEVEIAEHQLTMEMPVLLCQRLLDLQYQFRFPGCGCRDDVGASTSVVRVRKARAGTGISLYPHGVTGRDKGSCPRRCQRHTVLVCLDFSWNANLHAE